MSRRLSNAGARATSRQPPSKPTTADLITFRYEDEMVYVSPGPDYDIALNCAVESFPQLAHIPRDRIVFDVSVRMSGKVSKVRISRNAWAKVLSSLSRYEIVDIRVDNRELSSPYFRAAKSDTDVRTPTYEDFLDEKRYLRVDTSVADAPPQYMGADGHLRDSEKSPSYTLSVPHVSATPIKRSTSALGWLGKRLL